MNEPGRVPLSDRVPVGDQVGTCEFPMRGGHLCGRPVYAKSVQGRRPKYCGQEVVDDTAPNARAVTMVHNGKNAAKQREILGFNSAPAVRVSSTANVPGPPALPTAPDEFETLVVEAAGPDYLPEDTTESQAADSAEVQESDEESVTAAVDRVARLVSRLDSAAQVMAHAAEVLMPEVREALEAAGAAGAAEREIIEVSVQADQKIAEVVTARKVAEEARKLAEARAGQHAEARREMATERDRALAAEKAAREEAQALVARVQQEAEAQVNAAIEAREKAESEAEKARKQAESVTEQANALLADSKERVAKVQQESEAKVSAARKAQERAETEAGNLRNQVDQLMKQLDEERRGRRNEIRELESAHRKEIKELESGHRNQLKELNDSYMQAVKEFTHRGAPGNTGK